jgi:TonB family protein
MTMDTAQPGSWRPRSMWIGVVLVFLLQVGMIFWVGEKKPIYPRRPAASPVLQLATNANSEFLALSDPSLLALPHQEGFSGLAWLNPPPLTDAGYHPSERERSWTEEARWLPLSVEQLGAGFNRIVATNYTLSIEASAVPDPQLLSPSVDSQPALGACSSLRIEGTLAQWRVLKPFELPSWPARVISATDTDLLTNTVVQVVVDAQGRPVSSTLLTSSGSPGADDFALDQARISRFEPPGGVDPNAAFRANPLIGLCWGRLIFDWYTVPATNRPTGAPNP